MFEQDVSFAQFGEWAIDQSDARRRQAFLALQRFCSEDAFASSFPRCVKAVAVLDALIE